MRDWSLIQDAYGPATTIPEVIEALPSPEAWGELWGRLCREGTVYEASFAALDDLTRTLRRLGGEDRLHLLVLIASIIGSDDLCEVAERPQALIDPHLPELQANAIKALYDASDEQQFGNALEAYCSFNGLKFWGGDWQPLTAEELEIICGECGHWLAILFEGGARIAPLDWRELPEAECPSIVPGRTDELSADDAWLVQQLQTLNRPALVERVMVINGQSACSYCTAAINIRRSLEDSGDS